MIQPVSPTRADDGNVVHMRRDLRIPVRNPDAALAILFERPLRRHERIGPRAHGRDGTTKRGRHGLARQLLQCRLGVEQVKMTRSSLHEKPDDRLRTGRVMSRLRAQGVQTGLRSIGENSRGILLAQEVVQSEGAQSSAPSS